MCYLLIDNSNCICLYRNWALYVYMILFLSNHQIFFFYKSVCLRSWLGPEKYFYNSVTPGQVDCKCACPTNVFTCPTNFHRINKKSNNLFPGWNSNWNQEEESSYFDASLSEWRRVSLVSDEILIECKMFNRKHIRWFIFWNKILVETCLWWDLVTNSRNMTYSHKCECVHEHTHTHTHTHTHLNNIGLLIL